MFVLRKTYSLVSRSLNYPLHVKGKSNQVNATKLRKLAYEYSNYTFCKHKYKKNYAFFVKRKIKMNVKEGEGVEKEIEKYSQEISSLIERNESIKCINDEDIKKEYNKNEKIIEEKKYILRNLCNTPSESLTLLENRSKLESLVKRKLFYTNSFEIYGGVSGLIDYGPSGCLLKYELEKLWRHHFIFYDEMLEIKGTCITPYSVLKTSGHVDRFTDLMIRDVVTKDCYRADKYISEWFSKKKELQKGEKKDVHEGINNNSCSENEQDIAEGEMVLRKLDGMSAEEMGEVIKKYDIKSPTGNNFSYPFPFNLMFQTKIGPKDVESDKGKITGGEETNRGSVAFLRPETAQGIFVNFRKLLDYNGGKMPFAGAQIGLGFRNEISPRNGLLRVREFEMAEIEYFVNPSKKYHEKYYLYKHLMLPLFPRDNQLVSNGKVIKDITLEDAVNNGIIANEALAYFLARTYLFLLKCGINKDGIRYRQHLKTEMAHYANDCWDAEILTSYGFIEVVGHADRSAYDLKHHMNVTGANLYACEKYTEPLEVKCVKVLPNKAKIGSTFKGEQSKIYDTLNKMSNEQLLAIEEALEKDKLYVLQISGETNIDNNCTQKNSSTSFELTRDMVSFHKYVKKVQEQTFIPHVIEPSMGIGRLIFCILEHTFRTRTFTDDKEERHYLSLPYRLSPIKCSILPISNNKAFYSYIKKLQMILNECNISCKIDNSGVSIGKKYARTDEIGIPFAATIDFQTLKDKTITLRERDSMHQIRIDASEIGELVGALVGQKKTWADCVAKYGLFTQQNLGD
ncbi:glycine--tRNA ligase, putative (GlyRS) [Plasmodium ovale wallikeri]|uniref:glycine--tRNA ligase n=2 Tax=Plasmodium ovale TaxID=36330 RepID=A0A1A9ANN5_PLAOA|nr:glycine--tRNA ligase, putative (GlyRS) [Plasmodium ovale wallikeri]SBT57836.1 glycine--tRNA ligase, putative (GlyRS) [Plasmodium ovale wallikeri]SBT78865.1 glycine--tRNA ligase, putative [Plasmodium ovale]